jgi:LuxR family transcriptional regulator, maltose regulon positive regulatory protein
LRGHGKLTELRAADLRFTTEEAAALLHEGVSVELPDDSVTALTTRTEGWAAGLQLAALSLHGQADVARFVATFSGSHRYVLDFLAEEVLDRQPDQLRAFLLETSVLERLSGELCDAVTEHAGGQATLEEVERSNLFLVPLDVERRWWRYHHLFADLLRVRLQQEQPDRVAVLHHRAADWSQAHGLADDAVRHALAAGDAALAGRLVERHLDELLLRSERVTEPYEPSVGRAASLVSNVRATTALARAYHAELRGAPETQIAFGRRALAEVGEGELTLRAIIRGHLGVAEWLRGDLRESERSLAASVPELCAVGQRFLAVRICEHLGQVRRARGDLDAALAGYQQAMEIAAPPDQKPLPAAGIVHVRMAEVAYQRNHLDEALQHVMRGI